LKQLFKNYSFSFAYITNLFKNIYQVFSIHINNERTDKSAQKDIVTMAQHLSTSVRLKTGRTVRYPAIDTAAIGACRLASDGLPKFNSLDCLLGFSEIEAEILEGADYGNDDDVQDFFVSEESG
jgi:hypothetical protein